MAPPVLGVPPTVYELQQKGLIERAFHDGLYPNIAYRAEALFEEWQANSGTQIYMTRPGLIAPMVAPLPAGSDPTPKTMIFEQWTALLQQYADGIDVHLPTSVTSNADLFLRSIHQLGLQAGQSVNRIARNALFQAYLSGQTVLIAATAVGDSAIRVASLNGFTTVVNPGANVAPQGVSPAFPLSIRIGVITRSVIGAIPDNVGDPNGPGTLILSATVGAIVAIRSAVRSQYAPRVVRSAAGNSVDAIGAADTLTLQQAINAVAFLRNANVQPHEDGFYHAHISPLANAQFFADPVYQRLNQSLPEHSTYKEGFVGSISGILFFMNNESPNTLNTGTRTATGTSAFYSPEVGAETTNNAGVDIGRVIITGKGALYEKGLDESQYVTEAGTTGKIGEFDVVNNGTNVLTERIRLILAAPIDRMQQKVRCTWSITTSFPVPSDVTAPSGPELYKRAIILEHAS